jgi:Ca2+-binding RTX toxin-like protein
MYAQLDTTQEEKGFAIINGGKGDDSITVETANQITLKAEAGNDNIYVTGGHVDDSIRIEAGPGDDAMCYDLTSGKDSVNIDGGLGNDFLTIEKNQQSLQMLDSSGTVLYSVGSGGSVITVLSVEHGEVIGDDGKVAFQW